MEGSYNTKCPAVKRLFREAKELREPTEEYYAQPLDDNLFEWHFTFRGPPDSDFDGGVYHGRIVLPPEYPMKPPNIMFLTANGRFETNKKICLSISGHHPETWQPSWSIRTALLAIIGFMPTPAIGNIGGLDYSKAERQKLAKQSLDQTCKECGRIAGLLKERTSDGEAIQEEAKELASQVVWTSNKTPDDVSTNSDGSKEKSSTSELPKPPNSEENPATHNSEVTSDMDPLAETLALNQPSTSSMPLLTNTILLSASLFVIFALILRRLFLVTDVIDNSDFNN